MPPNYTGINQKVSQYAAQAHKGPYGGATWNNGRLFGGSDAEDAQPQPGEDYQSWVQRVYKEKGIDVSQAVGEQDFFDATATDQQKQDYGDQQKDRQDYRDQKGALQAFYKEMMAPLDMNDPKVQRVLNDSRGKVNADAANRGLSGGAVNSQESQQLLDTGLGLQTQRQQMGLSALNSGIGNSQAINHMREGQYEYDTNMKQQQAMAQYQSNQDQRQGIGGAIGGVLGGIGGFAVGGPMGAAAGAGMGSRIGGGIGGLSGGGYGGYRSSRGYGARGG